MTADPAARMESDWIPTYQRLPDEETVVELALLDGLGQPYRAFGCRYDGGEGWVWALATYGIPDDPSDCESDDDYDVFAWREPTPLPKATPPERRRFLVLRDRDEDTQEEVAIVTGRDALHEKMMEIGLAARHRELPPEPEPEPPPASAKRMGRCPEKRKHGGCPLHNLLCGYPKCDEWST